MNIVNKSLTRKILILAANPKDRKRLHLTKEVREIKEGLRLSQKRDSFEIYSDDAVRIKDFRRAMLNVKPNILHFCGHGDRSGLIFESDNGDSIFIEGDILANFIGLIKSVECVLLNTCYSKIQADEIVKHVDYVIGMKEKVKDEVAITFAVGFYDALGAGETITDAFKIAQTNIGLNGDKESSNIPVLLEKQNIVNPKPSINKNSFKEILDNQLKSSEYGNLNYVLEHEFGFQNCADETNKIINSSYALSIIDAPAGYGKSVLLEELKNKFKEEKYNCIGINLDKELALEQDIKKNIALIRTKVQKLEKVVLIFDNTEKLESEKVKILKDIVISSHELISDPNKLRVIFAGRYISTHFQNVAWGQYFYTYELLPLGSSTIQKFIEKKLFDNNIKNISLYTKLVEDISCGHPPIIIDLVRAIDKEPNTYLCAKKIDVFTRFALKKINDTIGELDNETQDALMKLAIFRKFNIETISELKKRNHLCSELDEVKLSRLIGNINLVRKGVGEQRYNDVVFRELLLKKMKWYDFDSYQKIQNSAIEIYQSWLLQARDKKIPGLGSLEKTESYIKEFIYHSLLHHLSLPIQNLALATQKICKILCDKHLLGCGSRNDVKEFVFSCIIHDSDISQLLEKHNVDLDIYALCP
ncbi:CHAT domain-containing protein [Candidatus Albibeggiatoa sp. nov. NOAA]|uniref:CHAT domain-containing protein n=1 Tax=Candidatus Albibeggiatoa sp. nov. NOAA TaxID=3162724 RepID=UPI0032F5D02C|nr:CHAT domain-containing protein [Thiotrichaceae bacterium]